MSGSTTIQQLIHEIPFTKFLKYFNYENIILDVKYQKYINYDTRNELILYYPKGKDSLYAMDQSFKRSNKVEFFFSHIKELNKTKIENILLNEISKIEDHQSTREIKDDFSDNEIITLFLDIKRLHNYEDESFDIKMFTLDPFQNKFFLHFPTNQPCVIFFNNKKIANLLYFNEHGFGYQYYDNNSFWISDYDLHTAHTPLITFNPYNLNFFFQTNSPVEYISIVPHIQCNYSVIQKLENFREQNNIIKDYQVLIGDHSKELEGYLHLATLYLQFHQKEDFTYTFIIDGDNATFYIRDSITKPDAFNLMNLQSLILSSLKDHIDISNNDVNSEIYDSIGYKVDTSIDNFIIFSFQLKYEYVINLVNSIFKYENVFNPFNVIKCDKTKIISKQQELI